MCYNCGCGMPNNDMGKEQNITNRTFDKASEAMGLSSREAKQNALDLLEKVLRSEKESDEKNWKPS